MEKQRGAAARDGRVWKRLLAALLALLLLFTLLLTNAIRVSIHTSTGTDSSSAATNYLVDNTQYVHLSASERAKMVLSQARADYRKSLDGRYEQASIAIAQGENVKALEEIEACLNMISPEHEVYEELRMKQGCLLALEGQEEQARTVFQEVLERNPKNAQAWLLQAQLLLQAGDITGAMEHMKQYLSLEQGDANQLSVMAQLCYGAGAYEEALTYGKRALKLLEQGGDGELYRCMGLAALLVGTAQEAEEYLAKAIGLLEDRGELFYYRGVCRLAQENIEGALEDFNAAIQGGVNSALAYYNRGVCYLALEDWEALKADLERVVELDEDEELTAIAKELLKELK